MFLLQWIKEKSAVEPKGPSPGPELILLPYDQATTGVGAFLLPLDGCSLLQGSPSQPALNLLVPIYSHTCRYRERHCDSIGGEISTSWQEHPAFEYWISLQCQSKKFLNNKINLFMPLLLKYSWTLALVFDWMKQLRNLSSTSINSVNLTNKFTHFPATLLNQGSTVLVKCLAQECTAVTRPGVEPW